MTTDEVELDETVDEWYVYGVIRSGHTLSDLGAGVDDRRVEVLSHGDIAAVVGPAASGRRVGRRAELVAHARVLDALAQQGPVIPVRFGSLCLSAEDVVTDVLEPQADRLREVLGWLTGRRQFTLRVRYDEQAVLAELVAEDAAIARLRAATRGRSVDASYGDRVRLGELVARGLESKRRVDSALILERLGPNAVEHHHRDGAGLDHLLDAAFLVDDADRDAFEAAAGETAELLGDRATMRLLGPTAPYDFVPERG